MNEYDNKKAIDFFGEEIVNNLETQHQDGYPNYYKKINSSSWQFGDIAEYIVPFNGKEYSVIVQDNVLRNPLFINQITDWKEILEKEVS